MLTVPVFSGLSKAFLSVHTHMYAHIHTSVYMYIYTCIYVCMRFCFQVSVLVREKLGYGNLELFLVGRCIKWFAVFLWVKKIAGAYLLKEQVWVWQVLCNVIPQFRCRYVVEHRQNRNKEMLPQEGSAEWSDLQSNARWQDIQFNIKCAWVIDTKSIFVRIQL